MDLASLIASAQEQGASDLHLEPGLPAAVRVRDEMATFESAAVSGPLET
jgi:Tfp pilus assembly pilus retraction ATPase PilT